MIIIDQKIPEQAKKSLHKIDSLLELKTQDIVYEAISGHPDIFFAQIEQTLIVSPNLPESYFNMLDKNHIAYVKGEDHLGEKYPETVKYNCVEVENHLIHNFRYTDSSITRAAEDHDLIHVDQGYTRCNLIALGNNRFITSDKGMEKTLLRFDMTVHYQDPEGILLPGHKNGFIGGCAGIKENQIFFIGQLKHLKESNNLREFIVNSDFEIVELYEGPMFDGGGLIFI